MGTETDPLSSAMDAAAEEFPEIAPVTPLTDDAGNAQDDATAPTAWEPPGWSKRWKEPSRKALEALYGDEVARPHLDPVLKELEETYGYIGRRDNEFAQYRRQFDPIGEVLGPYVQNFQLQGMNPQQGLQQMLAYSDALGRDPDNTFPRLAQMFKPRDAQRAIQQLAQAWGADLGQMAQGEPYVDPVVKAQMSGLQQRFQAMEQALYNQYQGLQHNQQAALLDEIQAFESATDANGKAAHPHFQEVFNDMVTLANMKRAKTVAEAYDMAVRLNPQLSASMAEKQALQAAARQTTETRQAMEASRNVSGKPTGREKTPSTIEDAMRAAERELSRAA